MLISEITNFAGVQIATILEKLEIFTGLISSAERVVPHAFDSFYFSSLFARQAS